MMLGIAGAYREALPVRTPFSRSVIFQFGLAVGALIYALDVFNIVGLSKYAVTIKYCYTAAIFACIYYYLVRYSYVNLVSLPPLMALFFFIVTGVTFALNMVVYNVQVSYVTAFTAPLVFAAAAFIPEEEFELDGAAVLKSISWLLTFGTTMYLLEAYLKASSITVFAHADFIEHVKSIVCVMAICMAILAWISEPSSSPQA